MGSLNVNSFAEATAVQSAGPHTYTGRFLPEWCIGTVPHGGVVVAVLMRAATLHFETTLKAQNQPDTLALHISFLNRTEAGPFEITIEHIKIGRQTSVVVAKLTQKRLATLAYITHTNFDNETGPSLETTWQLTPPPPPITLSTVEADQDPNWAVLQYAPFFSFAHAAQKVIRVLERSGPKVSNGAVDEWLTFKTHPNNPKEKFDEAAIGYVADIFPAPFDVAINPAKWTPPGNPEETERVATIWAPTVLMNIEIKKRLPPGGEEWLFQRVTTKMFRNGRYDLETVILDGQGELVAVSSHVVFVVDASRNTGKRSTSRL